MLNIDNYFMTPAGVFRHSGMRRIRICDPLDIVARTRINLPMAVPQSWLTLQFDANGHSEQALVLSSAIDDEGFWSLLGDLYQEGFSVTQGRESDVQQWLRQRRDDVHEFELCHSMPGPRVHLTHNRQGWDGLYNNYMRSPAG